MALPFRLIDLTIFLAFICPVYSMAAVLDEPIKPIPLLNSEDPDRAKIGRELFYDVRLSGNNRISCASCHQLKNGGGDSLPHSVGFNGKPTATHSPSVFNAALNFRQFWNGRADTLEAQIDSVMKNPAGMGSTWPDVVAKISKDASYQKSFSASYKDGVTKDNIQNALATFERTLITPNSRFDRYLRGDEMAITEEEKNGYKKFKQYGCVACHQGVNVGGNMFQKFGVMGDYFKQRGNLTDADLGRYLVTRNENDKYVFKVPSLRNVALRPPYFHDGSVKTLEEAVNIMFRYQLGRADSPEDTAAIVKFLNTLNGEGMDKRGKP